MENVIAKDKAIKLSILDQSPIRQGGTAEQAIKETVALAKFADRAGYTRFWVSEHHNIKSLAGSTPEVLIAHLAGETEHIRVGSGGVMLPNHSALKVAENFRMLETIFPGRIDLGIGRAPGGDRLTASLLNPSNQFSEQEFVQQMIDLQQFISDEPPVPGTHAGVVAIPVAATVPEYWMLTSSGGSGMIAAHFGMAVCFAQFINPQGGKEAINMYRQRFRPSQQLQRPQVSVAVFVLCADTEEKVKQLQFTTDYQILRLETGMIKGYPPYEEIKDQVFTDVQLQRIAYNRNRMVCGTPEQVKTQLTALAAAYEADEIVAVTITYDFKDRLRSYQLLAEVFALGA